MDRSTGTVRPVSVRAFGSNACGPLSQSVVRSGFATVVIGAVAAFSAAPARAGIITDRAFFGDIDSTLIDFETDGDGDSVTLPSAQSQSMAAMEYASQGLVFDTPVAWTNDGNGDFDAAQAIGASPDNAIPSSDFDVIEISFTEMVRAFGFFVATNNVVGDAPTLIARDADGAVIESVVFGDAFHHGTIGIADYGFMGVTSDIPIASVEITKTAAIFDDFHLSAVPGPGGVGLFGLAGLIAGRRRRRA